MGVISLSWNPGSIAVQFAGPHARATARGARNYSQTWRPDTEREETALPAWVSSGNSAARQGVRGDAEPLTHTAALFAKLVKGQSTKKLVL